MWLKTYTAWFLAHFLTFKDLSVKTTSQNDNILFLKLNIVSMWRNIIVRLVAPFISYSPQNSVFHLHFLSLSAWEYYYY